METQALGVSCAQNTELDEPLRFGVSTPGGFLGAGELQAVADAVGRRAEMVMAFEDFFATPPIAELAVVKYCGADPIITWEPWCWTDDRSPAVVQSVLSGALDDYASRWADEIRDWASTVYVRFAHEFNGDWYPWTPTFGTSARAYVEAWRRLHDIFADRGANALDPRFLNYVAGMQTYLPKVMCMLAPYVNSYRRLVRNTSAPINVRWGFDNRTVGLRVPLSDPANRRVENRVPSSDANPYLAIAASLACGYLGLVKELTPDRPIEGASKDPNFSLPRSILDAVRLLELTPELVEIFGATFVRTYRAIKETEYETFMGVISPWEREYLLLSV